MSSRASLLRVNRIHCQHARWLELLYLACALLLGALLAATTLAAAPLQPAHARTRVEQRRPPRAESRVVHPAPHAAAIHNAFDSK
jgi:hypothetical protein